MKKLTDEQKKALKQMVEELQDTDIMKEHYDKKWLDEMKKRYPNMTKEERLEMLFKLD